jgi:hypothetical protein
VENNLSVQIGIFEALVAHYVSEIEHHRDAAFEEAMRRLGLHSAQASEPDSLAQGPLKDHTGEPEYAPRAGDLLCRARLGGKTTCVTIKAVQPGGSLSLDKTVRWPSGQGCRQKIPAELVDSFLSVYKPQAVENEHLDNGGTLPASFSTEAPSRDDNAGSLNAETEYRPKAGDSLVKRHRGGRYERVHVKKVRRTGAIELEAQVFWKRRRVYTIPANDIEAFLELWQPEEVLN